MPREIIITGGAGFIGSHVQDRFLEEGDKVSVVDNLVSGHLENLHADTRFYEVDICDEDSLEKAFAQIRPDVVIHTAAQNQVPASMKDPRFDMEVNVRGMFNVLDAARKNGACRVIYTNTGGALYGELPGSLLPIQEDTPILKPTAFYSVSKFSGEQYLKLFGNLYDMTWISLRLANIYGPRQDPHGEAGIIPIFINKMLRGEVPIINGDGSHTRDYIYVADLVEAIAMSSIHGNSDYFNISTGVEVSNLDVFNAVNSALGLNVEPKFGPDRAGDVRRNALDNKKAKKKLGWSPTINLEDGIKLTANYMKK